MVLLVRGKFAHSLLMIRLLKNPLRITKRRGYIGTRNHRLAIPRLITRFRTLTKSLFAAERRDDSTRREARKSINSRLSLSPSSPNSAMMMPATILPTRLCPSADTSAYAPRTWPDDRQCQLPPSTGIRQTGISKCGTEKCRHGIFSDLALSLDSNATSRQRPIPCLPQCIAKYALVNYSFHYVLPFFPR